MRIKVLRDTAYDENGLCKSCKYSHIMEDDQGNIMMLCKAALDSALQLKNKVVKCNCYKRKEAVPLYQLERVAWILRTDKFGKRIGFKPYRDLTSEEQHKVSEETDPVGW
jgi:hypothetical protein